MSEITVIVPVYKVEKYLNRCIDSILTQSFGDFDLVLVDDGSPDSCPKICDSYAREDGRVTVIHKQNGGLSDARNAGIDWAMEHSDSEWLAFVDSDDYLHPDFLLRLRNAAKRESADLAICDFSRVNERDEIIEDGHGFFDLTTENKNQLFACLNKNWHIVSACTKLYHKHIFSQLRFEVGKIHEDSFAIHHVLWNCNRAVFISEVLYYYLYRSDSIMTSESPKSKLDGLEAMVEQYEFRQKKHILPLESIPVDYLNEFTNLRRSLDKQEVIRFKQLRKRLAAVYFGQRENRSLKRQLSFYYPRFYCNVATMLKKWL